MEYKGEKEMEDGKESIEKILSDLNGLLNRMPSILSDIKMPDIMKKNKFDYIEKEDSMFDNKAVRPQEDLNAEHSSIRQDIISDSGKNDSIADEAEKNNSNLNSNLNLMTFENGLLKTQETATESDMNESINLSRTGFPPFEVVPSVSALDKEKDSQKKESLEQNQYLGAPDIETLMKLAENEYDDKSVAAEQIIAFDGRKLGKSGDMQKQEIAAESVTNLSGGFMNFDEENKDLKSENDSIQNNQNSDADVQSEAILNPVNENVSNNEPAASQGISEKTIIAGPEDFKTMLSESSVKTDQEASDGEQAMATPLKSPDAEQQAMEANSGEIEAEKASEENTDNQSSESGLELNAPVELSSEADDDKTIVLEPTHSVFSDEVSQSPQEIPAEAMAAPLKPADTEQQTMSDGPGAVEGLSLVQSSFQSDSDDVPDAGEETIMAAPGDNPSQTNRMKYVGNIKDLVEKQIPDGIPDERIKPLIFLYTISDEVLCAEILNTMDAICLKSESKPMFVKRPLVKVCEPEMKGDSAQALVTEYGAMGLICVGDMPQEMIYDIENVFNTNKIFFRHIERENFNYSFIVDIISDLILI
ncbi:MAG: hypothetical protein L6420_05770 [Elusimicrobia bacterium]|nr:hypothetical protein [Elusimicrobiota bacterium]